MILNIFSDISFNTKFFLHVFQKIVCYDRDQVPVIIKLAEIKNRWTDLLTRLRCYSFISAGGNRFLSWCKDRNFFCNFQIFEQRNQEKVYFLNDESWENTVTTMTTFRYFFFLFLCFVQNNQYLCKCILPNVAVTLFE